ncbi:CPBP family intramembrane glutamic endopeptidase [Actinocorallia populi]|uniref:CPBP family intramembrane glutamic endopeptidase n=1 Tax=Actinocorallia populi TaxID=2079200 RepID=UPI000D096C92|nr:CPBP family intramembrane glutamic endopeptidase [Actinocorallia populi]
MRRNPPDDRVLTVFLITAFLGAGALGVIQALTPLSPDLLTLNQFGPALGVGLVVLLWPARVRALLAGAVSGRGEGAGRGGLLLSTAPLTVVSAAGVVAAFGGDVAAALPYSPLALFVVAQFVGACGEEIGWRCLMQPLLGERFGTLAAAVMVGLVWGVWHIQIFAEHPAYAVAFVVMAVALSVVMAVALDGMRAPRLLFAGGFHALVNLGMAMAMNEEAGEVLPMAALAAAAFLAASAWVFGRRGTRTGGALAAGDAR